MKLSGLAHVCQLAGLVALLSGALIFVVLFYRGCTVNWKLQPAQDVIAFRETKEAWKAVGGAGAVVGLVLLCAGAAAKALSKKRSG